MRTILSLLSLLLMCHLAWAVDVPERPSPARFVNDFVGVFPADKAEMLNANLDSLGRRTSIQITIVVVEDLGDASVQEFAQEVGEKWGVGHRKLHNGVVIVVCPKRANRKGQVFIAPGYGLEPELPDVRCSAIVRDVMIPHFVDEDYFGGVEAAVGTICQILAGAEGVSLSEYESSSQEDGGLPWGGILGVVGGGAAVAMFLSRRSKANDAYDDSLRNAYEVYSNSLLAAERAYDQLAAESSEAAKERYAELCGQVLAHFGDAKSKAERVYQQALSANPKLNTQKELRQHKELQVEYDDLVQQIGREAMSRYEKIASGAFLLFSLYYANEQRKAEERRRREEERRRREKRNNHMSGGFGGASSRPRQEFGGGKFGGAGAGGSW